MWKLSLLLFICVSSIFASGSREKDSLALLAIQETFKDSLDYWDNNGPDPLWDKESSMEEWRGVKLRNNRVTSLMIPEVTSLPDEIGNLTALCTLEVTSGMYRVYAATISEQLYTLENLEALSLYHVDSISSKIQNLKKLTFFYAHSEKDSFPVELSFLTNIKILGLSSNSLTLPFNLSVFSDLESIFLRGGTFTSIPKEIFDHKNLQSLLLEKCAVTSIPSDISKLQKLIFLCITRCKVETIANELLELPNLTTLVLYKNHLQFDEIEKVYNIVDNVNSDLEMQYGAQILLAEDSLSVSVEVAGDALRYKWCRWNPKEGGIFNDQFSNEKVAILPDDLAPDDLIHCFISSSKTPGIVLSSDTLTGVTGNGYVNTLNSVNKAQSNKLRIRQSRNTLYFTNTVENAKVTICDVTGRVLIMTAVRNDMIQLPHHISAGRYLLLIQNGDEIETLSFYKD